MLAGTSGWLLFFLRLDNHRCSQVNSRADSTLRDAVPHTHLLVPRHHNPCALVELTMHCRESVAQRKAAASIACGRNLPQRQPVRCMDQDDDHPFNKEERAESSGVMGASTKHKPIIRDIHRHCSLSATLISCRLHC